MVTASQAPLEEQLEQVLAEPIEAAKERERNAFDVVARPLGGRFVLFGAGNMGRRVLARLRQDGIDPIAFTDNRPEQWGQTIDGLDIITPSEAAARYGRDALFVVTIYNNQHNFPETSSQLAQLGCRYVSSVLPLRWKYSDTFLPYFRDDLPHKVLLQRDAIRDAYALWFDEPSRREFVAQVWWRLHGTFDGLGQPDPESEYFPQTLIPLGEDEYLVDVGAYDGDTVRRFIQLRGNRFSHILAAEPDPSNFQKLSNYVAQLPAEMANKIEPVALAVTNRTCRLRFTAGHGVASALSASGSIEVDGIRLDDLLLDQHPTYVKMDIEGAELDAIDGCRRVIAEERPALAICVYHAQDHLWKVPLAISLIVKDNRFFLRPHMPECWDTVCYSAPNERFD